MARFLDYFWGSNIAVWHDAIGEVLSTLEDSRQMAIASIYLATAALIELNERYAVLTGTQLEPSWQVETFREHLQEIIQASLMLSASKAGVSQVVAATTMVPPIIKSINQLRRWLLGFQYLPNRHFFDKDGSVVASVDGPYIIEDGFNTLLISISGGAFQTITLPIRELNASDVIELINAQLVGAHARPFGQRFIIQVDSDDAGDSIQIGVTSRTLDTFGLDTFVYSNAPAPDGSTGSLPTGWRLEAPINSVSHPFNLEASLFDIAPSVMRGQRDSPFHGLVTGTLINNPGFEDGFTGWDVSAGPNLFISTTKSRSGDAALGVITTAQNQIIKSQRLLVTPGRTITIAGYHQAQATVSVGSSILTNEGPSVAYRWTVANAIRHQMSAIAVTFVADPDDPLSDTSTAPPLSTVLLFDSAINFITVGVEVGMAAQVFSNGVEFRAVITAVGVHTLTLDVWRDATETTGVFIATRIAHVAQLVGVVGDMQTGVVTTTVELVTLTGPGGAALPASLSDLGLQFAAPNAQGGNVSWVAGKADKLQISHSPVSAELFYVRDIIGMGVSTVTVKNWAGLPRPITGTVCNLWIRPADGSRYLIWKSLQAIPS
jgi:hypothetical protein